MGTLLVDGDVPFPRASPFGLTSCRGNPDEGSFFVLFPELEYGIRELLGGRFFAFMRLLRNFQWYDFAELELSKEVKSYHENPCNRITGKKSSPRSFRMPLRNLERKQKRPLTGEISPTRGQAKGRSKGQRAMPVEKERPHPRGVSPSTGYVPI